MTLLLLLLLLLLLDTQLLKHPLHAHLDLVEALRGGRLGLAGACWWQKEGIRLVLQSSSGTKTALYQGGRWRRRRLLLHHQLRAALPTSNIHGSRITATAPIAVPFHLLLRKCATLGGPRTLRLTLLLAQWCTNHILLITSPSTVSFSVISDADCGRRHILILLMTASTAAAAGTTQRHLLLRRNILWRRLKHLLRIGAG